MTEDPNNQPLEDARTERIVRAVVSQVLAASPALYRPRGAAPPEDVNGFRDADGVYHEYWKVGDIVTEDGEGSNPMAP